MITDLFETITLYDNKAVSAKVQETPDHKYKVTLVVDARKMRANGEGAETRFPFTTDRSGRVQGQERLRRAAAY
jgi:ABC-2 type transport system permease protein